MDVDLDADRSIWQVYCFISDPREKHCFENAFSEHVKDEISILNRCIARQKRTFKGPSQEVYNTDTITEYYNLIAQRFMMLQEQKESFDFIGITFKDCFLLFLSPLISIENFLKFFGKLCSNLQTFWVGQVAVLHKFPPTSLIESRTDHINQGFDVLVFTERSCCESDLDMCHQRVGDERVPGSREPLSLVKNYKTPRHQLHPFVLYLDLLLALFNISTGQLGF